MIKFTFSIPCDAYVDIFYGLLRTFSSGPLRFCQQKPFSSLNCLVLILYLYIDFFFSLMLFSLLKHYLEFYITPTALKVSRSLYCFYTSISHGVENYFSRRWGTGISDAIFYPGFLSAK